MSPNSQLVITVKGSSGNSPHNGTGLTAIVAATHWGASHGTCMGNTPRVLPWPARLWQVWPWPLGSLSSFCPLPPPLPPHRPPPYSSDPSKNLYFSMLLSGLHSPSPTSYDPTLLPGYLFAYPLTVPTHTETWAEGQDSACPLHYCVAGSEECPARRNCSHTAALTDGRFR